MSAIARTAAALFLPFLFAAAPAAAQQADAFTAACMKSGTSASKCACQSKIARANLDRREQQAALSALRGDKTSFAKQVQAMGQTKAKAFEGKMVQLGQRSRTQCN